MNVWEYWAQTAAGRANLRLLVPGKGWVAYDDLLGGDGKLRERGSKEVIDSALVNALSATNFVTLIGSGASFCVQNQSGQKAPSMADLWRSVKDAVGDEKFGAVFDMFPNAKVEENIEKLLSLCKVYLELNEEADESDEAVQVVRDFVRQAEERILKEVDFVRRDTKLPAHETYVRKIGRRGFRKTRAKLFTTNYDLAFEEAARRLRFTVIDGFSHSLDQVYDRQHFDLDIVRREPGKEAPDYIPNVFHLYKLHGSVDWRRTEAEDVVRSRDNAVGKPVLIYPRSSKYQEAFEPPYLDMMGAFQAALREPDTALVVAGFGFNDDHISRPIMAALESNLTLRLIICDPGFVAIAKRTSDESVVGQPTSDESAESESSSDQDSKKPAHVIPDIALPNNKFLTNIILLAKDGDPRIHLINGRFEDLADALPDLIGETDRERHVARIKRVMWDNDSQKPDSDIQELLG